MTPEDAKHAAAAVEHAEKSLAKVKRHFPDDERHSVGSIVWALDALVAAARAHVEVSRYLP